jgi:quinohemoprotein ethanol dehydrogenase
MTLRHGRGALLAGLALLVLAACAQIGGLGGTGDAGPGAGSTDVSAQRLAAAAAEPGTWLSDGRTYSAQRYSPLTQIHAGNVDQLGIAWYDDYDTYRGIEATPLYADGVLYNILAWNIAIAYDARTGERLWTFDPQVPREMGRYACCEPVSRGLALWQDKVIIATLDGRVIALDRKSGQPVWSTRTFGEDYPYTITGAPRVFNGKVVVSQSGGDLGVRGFVIALDANTGEKLWKFFLTPGNPADGPDGEASDPIMGMIRQTWHGEYWKLGGGANAWDSIAYDPELDLVYVGTGNGSPLSWQYRSDGKGDNLFVCSIVALNGKDGSYVWHYQMVPEEDWDYTCTSSMISATLEIEGQERKVLMQAPKNGFFYVLDRKTGEVISAKPYVKVTWADSVDPVTGRPNINTEAHYDLDPVLVYPGPGGAHNWFPMAYSPRTQLAYFPAYQSGMVYARDPNYAPKPFRSNSGWGGYTGPAAEKRNRLMEEWTKEEKTWLIAYDPAKQEVRWRFELPRHGNGGVMVTASDLVFEGTTNQDFAAFDARTGQRLWSYPIQSAPVAGSITYELDGEQYIAVNAGWGGGAAGIERAAGIELPRAPARLVVFKLGGTRQLPPLAAAEPIPSPPPLRASEAEVQRGAQLYAETCAVCHGEQAMGGIKDLRHMSGETHGKFKDIVLGGIYVDKGMASFADLLSDAQVSDIHAYLIARANEDWGEGAQ